MDDGTNHGTDGQRTDDDDGTVDETDGWLVSRVHLGRRDDTAPPRDTPRARRVGTTSPRRPEAAGSAASGHNRSVRVDEQEAVPLA